MVVDRTLGENFARRRGQGKISETWMHLVCFKSGPECREREDEVFASLLLNSVMDAEFY